MKQTMKKLTAVCMAAMMGTAACLGSGPVTAETAYPEYNLYMAAGEDRADTVYVSAEEVANGDVVIPVSVYMESEEWTDPCITYMRFAWEPTSWDAIRFQNPMEYAVLNDTAVTYEYSGGTFVSKLTPYMLARLTERRGTYTYTTVECMEFATDYVIDPIFGETIRTAGENLVTFDISYYASEEDKLSQIKTEKTVYADVIQQEDGSAVFTYEYIRQDNYETDTATGTIPLYDPTLPEGFFIQGRSDLLIWQYTGIGTTSFLGESDEFPATQFEAVLQQGTPCGTYEVNFRSDTFINGDSCTASELRGLTIVVTEAVPETTTTTTTTTTTPESTTTTTTTATTTTTPEPTTTTTTTTTPEPTTTTTTTTTQTTTMTTTTIEMTTETTTTTTAAETTTATETTIAYENPYLSHTGVKMYPGMQFQLRAYNTYDAAIQWKSTDEEIASISQDGVITANALGTCKVYTIVRGRIMFCTVNVEEGLCGDVNLDEKISLIDAVWMNKYLVGVLYLNEASLSNADCYADNEITAMDVHALMRYLTMTADVLPVEPEE